MNYHWALARGIKGKLQIGFSRIILMDRRIHINDIPDSTAKATREEHQPRSGDQFVELLHHKHCRV